MGQRRWWCYCFEFSQAPLLRRWACGERSMCQRQSFAALKQTCEGMYHAHPDTHAPMHTKCPFHTCHTDITPTKARRHHFPTLNSPFVSNGPAGGVLGWGLLDDEPFLIWKMGPKKLIMGNIAKLLKKIVANHETKMGNHLAENSEIIKICACTFCPTPE